MKVLLPDFLQLVSTPEVIYVGYRPEEPIPPQHYDAEVLVLWGNRWDTLREDLEKLSRLRLLQTLSAGYEHVLAQLPASRAQVQLCCGVGLHDQPVAEYCLMMLLVLRRDLPRCWQRQQQCHWPALDMRQPLHNGLLSGLRVLICGFGHIGSTLAGYLQPLGVEVSGIARQAGKRDGVTIYPLEQMAQLLAQTDALVNLLPGGLQTRDIYDEKVFAQLPAHALFINAGRGSSVREDHLIAALKQGKIAAAAIDVAQGEPLKKDSPLWQAPNLLLTPHIAGNQPRGWQQLLQENLHRLALGHSLVNLVQVPCPPG